MDVNSSRVPASGFEEDKLLCDNCGKRYRSEDLAQCRDGHLLCESCIKKAADLVTDGIKSVRHHAFCFLFCKIS